MTTEERLKKLEHELSRANRRIHWLLAGATLSVAIGLLAWVFAPRAAVAQPAATTPKEIHAAKFVLEGENNKVCAVLSTTKNEPGLYLTDEAGKARVILTVGKDGPELDLTDDNGTPSIRSAVSKDGPSLALYDAKGKLRAALSVGKDGAGLDLSDETGKIRANLAAVKDGPAMVLAMHVLKVIYIFMEQSS